MGIFLTVLPLAVGGAAAVLTMDAMAQYSAQPQPPLAPPAWVFPAVWTVLYLLMGAGEPQSVPPRHTGEPKRAHALLCAARRAFRLAAAVFPGAGVRCRVLVAAPAARARACSAVSVFPPRQNCRQAAHAVCGMAAVCGVSQLQHDADGIDQYAECSRNAT